MRQKINANDTNRQPRQRSRQLNRQNKWNKNQRISQHIYFQTDTISKNKNIQKQYDESAKAYHQVFDAQIGKPKIYLIWKHPKSSQIQKQKQKHEHIKKTNFKINIVKFNHPPSKVQQQSSRLSELKDQITPVQQIWGQIIKQYLNDTEFVQIYRKKNSLSYGQTNYGKTIIQYDELRQKKHYQNQSSQYNIFSRAYFKLWEILSLGILNTKKDKSIVIANLAEGPGGFIHSLIDFRLKQNKKLQDQYYAITLKIQQGKTRNAKDWSDYRGSSFFQKIQNEGFKVKLSYGQKDDGNLYDIQNIKSFKTDIMKNKQAFLVTGDGGIECIGDDEFHYQEIFNAKLFFAEIITAFRVQESGGVFVLKIYDIHFQITLQLIMLLSLYYRKVGIIKPLTSRPGNSQKYVLCQGFLGISQIDINSFTDLLKQWHNIQSKLSYFQNNQYLHSILSFASQDQSENSNKFEQTIRQRISTINSELSKDQQNKIQQGLTLIKSHNGNKQSIKRQIEQKRLPFQISYAYAWCKKYGLKPIHVRRILNKQ